MDMVSLEGRLQERVAELETEVSRLRRKLQRISPDVRTLLGHRGFRVFRSASATRNVLLPRNSRYKGPFIKLLSRYSFRLFLRDIVRHYDDIPRERTTRFITGEVYGRYLAHLTRWELVSCRNGTCILEPPVRSFGPTLEWWVEYVLKKRLGIPCLRQVAFRGLPVGGDFDLIASLEGRIAYIEVKSSPPKQIYEKEMNAFLNRGQALEPDLTILLVDTELRMKDKLVPMMEEALSKIPSIRGGRPKLRRLESEIFHRRHKLYLVNAKGGIEENLRTVVADHLRNSARPS